MALNMLKRGGVAFDLMKDGNVSNETLYTNLDVMDQATLTKYVTAIYKKYGPARDAEGNPITNPSPGQLIGFTFQQFRKLCADAMGEQRVIDAGRQAQETEKQVVIDEAESDLGTT